MRNSVIAGAVALVVLAGGIVLALKFSGVPSPSPTPTTNGAINAYTNTTYGYSVSYPASYESHELQPEFAVIGNNVNSSFVPKAAIAVLHAGLTEPFPTYEDFVRLSVELACQSQGSGETIQCPSVASSENFTTETGITGDEIFLNQTTRTSAGQTHSEKRGPYFVFNISANVPQSKYALVMILPPPTSSQADVDQNLLTSIANSLQIGKVKQ